MPFKSRSFKDMTQSLCIITRFQCVYFIYSYHENFVKHLLSHNYEICQRGREHLMRTYPDIYNN
jgi:hypothetical protein